MSTRDKNKLIGFGAVIALILFCFCVHYGMLFVPLWAVTVIAVIVQCFFIVPSVMEKRYRLYSLESPRMFRFVPIVNEALVFDSPYSVISLASLPVCAVVFLVSKIPLSVVGDVLGMRATLAWGYNWTVIFVLVVVATNFIYGYGWCAVLRSTNSMLFECVGGRASKWEAGFYVLLLLPFVRIGPLMMVRSKMDSLFEFGYGTQETQTFKEVE